MLQVFRRELHKSASLQRFMLSHFAFPLLHNIPHIELPSPPSSPYATTVLWQSEQRLLLDNTAVVRHMILSRISH